MLASSKRVYFATMAMVAMSMIHELQKIKKGFLWGKSSPKIKYSTLSKDHIIGGWKGVDIFSKVISLQYAWI